MEAHHEGIPVTLSPGLTDVTPSPTDSTMQPASCPRMEGNMPSASCKKKKTHTQTNKHTSTYEQGTKPTKLEPVENEKKPSVHNQSGRGATVLDTHFVEETRPSLHENSPASRIQQVHTSEYFTFEENTITRRSVYSRGSAVVISPSPGRGSLLSSGAAADSLKNTPRNETKGANTMCLPMFTSGERYQDP